MVRELIFLGTSCMIPTKERAHISNALFYEGEVFLFDCGENTQLQIKLSNVSIGSIKKIFISHFHADHTLGLLGLIQTLSNIENFKELEIYGPKNTKKFISHMLKSTIFNLKIKLKITELKPKKNELLKFFENDKYTIYCSKLNHGVECLGYRFCEKDKVNIKKDLIEKFKIDKDIKLLTNLKDKKDIEIDKKKYSYKDFTYIKKGIKVSFVFDTRPCETINQLVKDCDYLIMEATFSYEKHKELAKEYEHMSAYETALVAKKNNVKNLIITHFSQRYKSYELLNEAKKVFENTIEAKDFLRIKI